MSSYGSPPGGTPPPQQPPPQQQPQQMPPQMPPAGMMNVPPAPPRKRSPLLVIGIIVLVVIVVCVVGAFALFGTILTATQPVADAGEAYMVALRDGNYARAFDLSSSSLQQEAGNADGLQAVLSAKQPDSWSFTSRSVNNDQGALSGTTKYKDGSTGTVDMALAKSGNDWKVSGISLK